MSYLDKASEELTAWFDDTTWLPFVEDENCNITGPGHQNKAVFAMAVNEWEWGCGSSPDFSWVENDIEHWWVVADDGDEYRWHRVPEGTAGAVPVTCIWGQR